MLTMGFGICSKDFIINLIVRYKKLLTTKEYKGILKSLGVRNINKIHKKTDEELIKIENILNDYVSIKTIMYNNLSNEEIIKMPKNERDKLERFLNYDNRSDSGSDNRSDSGSDNRSDNRSDSGSEYKFTDEQNYQIEEFLKSQKDHNPNVNILRT